MNHSLGALLTLKNEEGFEQAIYYLRRTLNEAECRYNPVEKECLALVLAIQKTRITWLGNHPCHFKSQSPADPHDKAGIIVFQIGQLGHIIVSIWHDLCTSEGNQGSNSCRFSSSSSYLDNFKAAWRYPGRDHRSQQWPQMMEYDKCSLTAHQEQAPKAKLSSEWGWCLSRQTTMFSCFLINGTMFQ